MLSDKALSRLTRGLRSDPQPLADLMGPAVATDRNIAMDLPLLGGRYKLLKPIGGGGMGTVYLARDVETGIEVAVKVPHLMNIEVDRRFSLETAAVEAVISPSVVSYVDRGNGVTPFLVTELLRGDTLAQRVRGRGKMSAGDAFATMKRLAAALAAVHLAGWVHRDIKPGNVLVSDAGEVRLIDFGLARPVQGPGAGTHTGQLMGTLSYLAPEQLDGHRVVDTRTDVFAFGCIAYECATAEHAFRRTVAEIAAGTWSTENHRSIDPEARGVDGRLSSLIRSCAALRPEDRPRDGLETLAWMVAHDARIRDTRVTHPLSPELRHAIMAGHRRPVAFVGDEGIGKTDAAIATGELIAEVLAPAGIVFLRGNPKALARPGAHAHALEALLWGYGYRNAARALAGQSLSFDPDEPMLIVVADDVDAMDELSVSRLKELVEVGLARVVATARNASPAGFEAIPLQGVAPSTSTIRPFARWVLRMAAMFGTTFPENGVKRLIGGAEAEQVPRALTELRELGVIDNLSSQSQVWSFRRASVWRQILRTVSPTNIKDLAVRVASIQRTPNIEARVIRFTSNLALPPKEASPSGPVR